MVSSTWSSNIQATNVSVSETVVVQTSCCSIGEGAGPGCLQVILECRVDIIVPQSTLLYQRIYFRHLSDISHHGNSCYLKLLISPRKVSCTRKIYFETLAYLVLLSADSVSRGLRQKNVALRGTPIALQSFPLKPQGSSDIEEVTYRHMQLLN